MSNKNRNWRNVSVQPGTVFASFNENLGSEATATPSFDGSSPILVASDYSGASNEEPYVVYSFLITTGKAWASWEETRLQLRKHTLPDDRRMSYKKLGDVYRRNLLKPLLSAADQMDGLAISLAISKAAPSIFPPEGPIDLNNPEFSAFRSWKRETLDKAFLVIQTIGILVAGIAKEGQDVLWFTDQDEVAANPAMLTALTRALAWVSSNYLQFSLGNLRCGTTACDNGTRQIEDFVCIPDLIAGALSEQFRSSAQLGISDDRVLWLSGAGMKEKAQEILFPFGTRQERLKKHLLVIHPTPDGRHHKVSWFNFARGSGHSETGK
ncbi:MAG TPA: hypothetical protein VLT36_14305 [Candidatus Dormibacteraeota bacterium]|nr:hypothetical protein [Candidatus Dormibacteraeota bacterium]